MTEHIAKTEYRLACIAFSASNEELIMHLSMNNVNRIFMRPAPSGVLMLAGRATPFVV
ncbi:hypothetical protein [Parazoarcus communis]|jgi:hypothetical protein|nr:hypothetical protein [Parazoarcus communis]